MGSIDGYVFTTYIYIYTIVVLVSEPVGGRSRASCLVIINMFNLHNCVPIPGYQWYFTELMIAPDILKIDLTASVRYDYFINTCLTPGEC